MVVRERHYYYGGHGVWGFLGNLALGVALLVALAPRRPGRRAAQAVHPDGPYAGPMPRNLYGPDQAIGDDPNWDPAWGDNPNRF